MPAAGDDSMVNRFGGSLAVDVEGLRIELHGEIDDLLLADRPRTGLDHGADFKVFKIPFQLRHDVSPKTGSGALAESRLRDETRQMMIGVAEHQFDHRQPLEIVRHRQLVGPAQAAVQLDRLLADELLRQPDAYLGSRYRAAALLC